MTRDDTLNKVAGMTVGMEYRQDSAVLYTAYVQSAFDAIDFSGSHTLYVRYAAAGINPFGPDTVLTFTTNPVTPPAPAVTRDDTLNKVAGMTVGMEYRQDSAVLYTAYVQSAFDAIDFSGNHTLYVRYAAAGINPFGPDTVLTFTTNPVTPPTVAKAKAIFTFDDGWKCQLTYAFPILEAAGFKATAYLNRDAVIGNYSGIMSLSDARTLSNSGWDISNHTTNHHEIGNKTDAASLAELRTMYLDNQNWIINTFNNRGAYHAAYPSGLYTNELIAILKSIGVQTGRATNEALQPTPVANPDDYYTLPVETLSSNWGDMSYTMGKIDEAVRDGKTIIFMIHKVDIARASLTTITTDFQQIVSYCKSYADQSKLSVMTMSEWYNYVNGNNPVTPPAPAVTRDDTLNTVTGMATGMEYRLDSAAIYTAYVKATFDAINFSGNHTLYVRYAAAGNNPYGPDTVLTFTTNPVTPPAPAVTRDDTLNTVTGMATGMEYRLDSAAIYTAYVKATFDALNFSGNHTLYVRYAAAGNNPYGPDTVLTFTTNPVTPPAPAVTRDDTLNTVTGMATGMEYRLDSAAIYTAYVKATFDAINFSGNHTLYVRYAAAGDNPYGPDTVLTFTTNPVTPPANVGKIIFTFDDGKTSQYLLAMPILEAAGFKGTAYVYRDSIVAGQSGTMNLTQLRDLYAKGWDIGNHTTSHEEIGSQHGCSVTGQTEDNVPG